MEILRACNLTFAYDYTLFENVNLSFLKGESSAIVGVSGCGKSTLLHILSTLLKPNNGDVYYNEKSLYTLSDTELNNIRRLDFGIIFQAHYLFKGFSGAENIQIANILSNQDYDKNLFERLGIDKILNQKIGELSGGQQQRISIARVLSKKPKVIFADEPTGNLDKNTAFDVMDILFEYIKQNQATLILVTHDNDLAVNCDNKFRLENKQFLRWS
ncbi:ABC transporter ATP-binding protein [Campylobacter pinnipediorum]|uniref:ABC transporter ATP-binding protein n=1 Tax=Campylobacter pinnipediorum subsp. pinnipediorum TaxID=1660067 RepID=A0AAX0L8G1_9BACT|nr:ABC transporter ATP-binding protein [Campylobacter pinnipediorum]AQW80847.1 ABC transporter, ATP-binding protein [Campylobacter pinnipediorum subsp. pinnipediorum]AQW82466.1 ABC transporter, ATP-binding protein [Campylobacter pinnipediorum subsp. pinnipediorum]AQW84136.1 ABC transporter, ATP-binding protein [Campylobacter pinnipediorum subsp. pinnipediorum]OPA74845.1 ABC transporter ATP-binding protein [Campylobacter pinnipediorum subsp. pinnipediorum]